MSTPWACGEGVRVGDRGLGDDGKPPGEAAPEGWTSCLTCGSRVKRKNLKRHVQRKHEKKRARMEAAGTGGGPRPGRKAGPGNPALSNLSDDELSSRVATINRELGTLVPGFHAQRMSELSREKRVLVGELKSRKASGLSRQWGRWYGGPGKVRHYRGRPG